MHNLLVLTKTFDSQDTSEDVRDLVHDILFNDPSFCGTGGRFGAPVCDWFVIGGQWSGHLAETLLTNPLQEAFSGRCSQEDETSAKLSVAAMSSDELNRIWRQIGGQGLHPKSRIPDVYGEEDDAMLVTRELYDAFLAKYHGISGPVHKNGIYDFADLDDDEVSESFIGRKWIIVVDYHY